MTITRPFGIRITDIDIDNLSDNDLRGAVQIIEKRIPQKTARTFLPRHRINLLCTLPMKEIAYQVERRLAGYTKPLVRHCHWAIVVMKGTPAPGTKAQSWARTYRDVFIGLVRDGDSMYDRKSMVAYEGRFTVHYGKGETPSPNGEYVRLIDRLMVEVSKRNRLLDRRRGRIRISRLTSSDHP